MIGEINLRTKSIPLASILPKEQFRLLSLKIFQTLAISPICSQNHLVMIHFRAILGK